MFRLYLETFIYSLLFFPSVEQTNIIIQLKICKDLKDNQHFSKLEYTLNEPTSSSYALAVFELERLKLDLINLVESNLEVEENEGKEDGNN